MEVVSSLSVVIVRSVNSCVTKDIKKTKTKLMDMVDRASTWK